MRGTRLRRAQQIDDAVAHLTWLRALADVFVRHPGVACVTGLVLPGELATPEHVWFEQFGGHSKGRGFRPDTFSPATAHIQSPLYPLPPFGTGANMTFRPGVIEKIGGWDTALGAGTPAMGSASTPDPAYKRSRIDEAVYPHSNASSRISACAKV